MYEALVSFSPAIGGVSDWDMSMRWIAQSCNLSSPYFAFLVMMLVIGHNILGKDARGHAREHLCDNLNMF